EMKNNLPEYKKIVIFDGGCNLCNSTVNYIIESDKNDIFRFASLQSEIGQELVSERDLYPNELVSVILIETGIAYYRQSTSALDIAGHLSGGISYLKYFSFLPEGLRDSIYDFIAGNRYKWFGKKDTCMLPTANLLAKFLE